MTLRLSSLFEIHIKRIISGWNTKKKYYKKKNVKTASRKRNKSFSSLRNVSCNGLSDSSDEDSYKENTRNARASRTSSKTKNSHISSPSSRDKRKNYSDSDSCSGMDTSNSDDASSKGQNKEDHENGIDSEDSYKPNSKYNHKTRRNNSKSASHDDDLNSSNRNNPEKERNKRKSLGIASTDSENEKQQSEGRVVRSRQKKPSMYDKLPSTSRVVVADTENSSSRNLRSGLHHTENEECSRNSNCRPTRMNSRKSYLERKKSDEENSQEVIIIKNILFL